MLFKQLTIPAVSHKNMQNKNGEEFVITDRVSQVRFNNNMEAEFTYRTFSHNEDRFYIFTTKNYRLLVQKYDWGNNAHLSNVSEDKYIPRIIIDMPLDENEKPEVSMKTTAYSDDFTIEETEKFADRFRIVANEMKWITDIVNNIEQLS